jgi:uncharacterized protein YkwD
VARIALVLALCLVAVPATALAHPADTRVPSGATAARVTQVPSLETQVLSAINRLRASHGLSRLRLNPALAQAALGHSQSMGERGFFGHEGYDGSAFWERIKPTYAPRPGATWSVGENLVWAAPDLSTREAMDEWMASPPHRANLLAPAWREIGLGAVRALSAPGVYDGLNVTILTADFGVR